MSVVSKERINFPGKGEFTKIVKYSSKTALFTIELPNWMIESVGEKKVEASTERDVRYNFDKAYAEYKGVTTKKRKVIAYTVQINACIMSDDGEMCVFKQDDIHFCDADNALSIGYKVVEERIYNTITSYFNMDGRREDEVKSGWVIIDWTEQREKFFKKTEKELQTLILRVNEFFKDDKKFLNMIDNNQLLLG